MPWEVEVEQFVRNALFARAFDEFAQKNDPRLLLLFHRKSELIGVAAHERTQLRYGKRKAFAATKLEVVAIARKWQGQRFKSGERVSDVLMSAVMTDVAGRVPPRDARVRYRSREERAQHRALRAARPGRGTQPRRPQLSTDCDRPSVSPADRSGRGSGPASAG